jgi:hypothetical protein
MDIQTKERTERIWDLNDAFRRTFSGGKVMMTCGVAELPDMVKARALQLAATFDQFTEDNDPHGEQVSLERSSANSWRRRGHASGQGA